MRHRAEGNVNRDEFRRLYLPFEEQLLDVSTIYYQFRENPDLAIEQLSKKISSMLDLKVDSEIFEIDPALLADFSLELDPEIRKEVLNSAFPPERKKFWRHFLQRSELYEFDTFRLSAALVPIANPIEMNFMAAPYLLDFFKRISKERLLRALSLLTGSQLETLVKLTEGTSLSANLSIREFQGARKVDEGRDTHGVQESNRLNPKSRKLYRLLQFCRELRVPIRFK